MLFDTKKFGAYISKLRKDKDMTQSELSDILNVTRQAVSKYENGESFPDISILILIADTFGITIDNLINSGEPTKTEAEILQKTAFEKEISDDLFKNNIACEIVNIAPYLKPSVLDNMAVNLSKYGIDISNIVSLAEYMNDKSVVKLLENANFDLLDERMLEKFIPFLDNESKENIFDKILSGELDSKLIKTMLPYMDYNFYSLVEAAVVEGQLSENVLNYIYESRDQ